MASLYLLVLATMLTKSSVCIDPIIYFGLNPQVIFWPCCSLYKTDPDIYSIQSGSSVLPSVPIGAVSMAGKRFNNLKTWSHHNSLLLCKDSFFNRAEPQEVLHCTFEEVSWLLQGWIKSQKKFITVWHGFQGILKRSGSLYQASLKLSAGFSNKFCLIS